jgi:hypothetical protein
MSYLQSGSAIAFVGLDNPGTLEKSYVDTLREAVKNNDMDSMTTQTRSRRLVLPLPIRDVIFEESLP